VSGTTHRAIEVELEKQFGFRRLGPTAQERLRRMLATNDALDRTNRLFVERFIYAYPHQTLFSRDEIQRARALLKQPSPSQPPPVPTWTPRPRTAPDMSQLCVGAVFELKDARRPHKVIAFDELEVFYDVGRDPLFEPPEENWTFGLSNRTCVYYRHTTPLFLDGAKRLRVEEPTPQFNALHRPDLPLRYARSPHAQWHETPLPSREEFMAYLHRADASLLELPPLNARELALIPRSPKGAFQRPVLVNADHATGFSAVEILWQAHQLQRRFKHDAMTGIGLYRLGLAKKGVPSFLLGCHLEPGSLLEWHEKAPLAP
jgi:hypothetical protein